MNELITTVTKKGQVTIPSEIRKLLGLKVKDKVVFKINNSKVLLEAA
ncbi:MAG: type II toxin-antitoxin system PrlF family antitoxin [Actinobacteria bacterium]|nr:type II toxin-antitoxin system PrlF family antitoxin [Actinomycetota bacterium]